MTIIGLEIKKLLNWKVLCLVLLLSLLFYVLFLRFHFEYFPNGRPVGDSFNITKQMIEKYGHEMDETVFQDFQDTYKKEVDRAENYLQSRADFDEIGITTYEQFRNMRGGLRKDVMFDEGIDVFWELQARETIISAYERRKEGFLNSTAHIDNLRWKQEIVEDTSINAILPHFVFENYNELIKMLAVLIILSVMIIVGRTFIIDQKNNVITLQYTTYIGRDLYKKKIIASMITAFLITTVYLGILLLLYAGNDTLEFFQSSMHAFETYTEFWLDITFLEYIILTTSGVYIIALIAACIATFLSRVVANYISLIGAQIPVAVVIIVLIFEYLISKLLSIEYPLYVTIGTYFLLFIIATTLLTFRWIKEKKLDIT